MHNIIQIIKDDFKMLAKNSISLLVVIGLVCIPSIYSWLNLSGCWDPYKNTGTLQVAVVNEDLGYDNKYFPTTINIGNSTVSSLYQDTSFKWVFVDNKDDALDGLNKADYYAVLVIPQDFSKKMMSLISDKAEQAELIYYSNEKQNAIAPKLTGQGANSIQVKINNTFQQTLLQTMLRVLTNGIDGLQSQDVGKFIQDTSRTFGSVADSLKGAKAQLESVQQSMHSLNDLVITTKGLLPVPGSEKEQVLRRVINESKADLNAAKTKLGEVKQIFEKYSIETPVIDEITNLINDIESIDNSAINILDDLNNATYSLQNTLGSIVTLTNDLDNKFTSVEKDFDMIANDLNDAKLKIDALSGNSAIEDLREIIGESPDNLAVKLTSPVKITRTALYPVRDNGSAMAAFCTSLAIWIGPLLLAAMMKVNLSEKRLRKMKNVKNYQLYFGRYVMFGFLSFLQATLVMLGNLFFMQIQCVHPFLFFFTGWILSLIFSLLIYTLVVSFANVGKSIAVILLVLQVAGAGGIFPHELLQQPFAALYPYLPFSWSIDAFHYCIAGFNSTDGLFMYVYLVALPALVIIPISLLMGLVLRVPIIRLNKVFIDKLEETGVMG